MSKQLDKYQVWYGNILTGHVYAKSKTNAFNQARNDYLNDNKVKRCIRGEKPFVCKISNTYYDAMVQNNIDICKGTGLMSTD